jgi:hypothetical protein
MLQPGGLGWDGCQVAVVWSAHVANYTASSDVLATPLDLSHRFYPWPFARSPAARLMASHPPLAWIVGSAGAAASCVAFQSV